MTYLGKPSVTTSTGTLEAPTGTSASILAANTARKGGWVRNLDDLPVYIGLGVTAATNKPSKLDPGQSLPFVQDNVIFKGQVNAITSGGTGSVEVVEL